MNRLLSRLIISGLLAVAMLTAVAFAATPKTGTWQGKLNSEADYGESAGGWKVTSGGKMRPVQGSDYIYAPSNFECNSSNLALVKTKVPIEDGTFVYKGKAYPDFFRKSDVKGDLTWKGEWTKAGKVKGTIRFQSPITPKPGGTFSNKDCDTGKVKWSGRPSPYGGY
jgi:hypothetical protein